MELDFKKYNIVDSKEDEIEKIIYMQNPKTTNIKGFMQHMCDNRDIIMLSTLMSMLFKIRSKSIYMKDKIDKSYEHEKNSILITEEIIWSLYKKSKNSKQIKKFLSEYDCIIENRLLKYYSEKNTNYIEKNFFLETILNQNSQKEILSLNPFMINDLLEYQQRPLTYEEKLIRELIDYYIEAQQYYDTPNDIKYVIKLLINNNSNNIFELERKLLYIISNVYQQSKEQIDKSYYYKISKILEETKYTPHKIINFLNNNIGFLNEIIEKFIDYNMCIEEGRLEELEKQPSAQYAKKIYRKNP